jgi:aminoglycoside 3-N-acetyltransferase
MTDLSPAHLVRLGLAPEQPLLVHASLRRLGMGRTGAPALYGALSAWAASGGSAVIVPAFTFVNEDPAGWVAPAPRPDDIPALQAATPAYDRQTTPASPDLGFMTEYVRNQPGAFRSGHPSLSFAAFGPAAGEAVLGQPLDLPLGWRSPLGWLYARGGAVLMVGTGLETMTLLHLAETEAPVSYLRATRRRVRGGEGWVWFWGAPNCGRGFVKAAEIVDRAVTGRGALGRAETVAVNARQLVDQALERLASEPGWLICDRAGCPFCGTNRAWLRGEINEIRYGAGKLG